MGRNPPKNLSKSTSLKDYLKTSDPVKLAKMKEKVRQERAISKALKGYESASIPEVPSAQEEVQEVINEIAADTGAMPTPEEVEQIKINVLDSRRRRGVQPGAKRGKYKTPLSAAQSLYERELQRKAFNKIEEVFLRRKAEREASAPFSVTQSSPVFPTAVIDSTTGQVGFTAPTISSSSEGFYSPEFIQSLKSAPGFDV